MRVVQAGPGGDVDKAAAAAAVRLIVVKHHAAQVGHHQVVVAVVIEIADGAAHPEARAGQTGLLGHVREGAVAVIAIELAGRPRCPVRGWQKRAGLDTKKVGPTVVVVIDPGHAAAHHFRNVVHGGLAVEVLKVDAAGGGHIDKPRQAGRWP